MMRMENNTEQEMEISYKELSKFEKFEEFKELNFSKCERSTALIYLKALWLNDTGILNEYERFGKNLRQILMNKRQYDTQILNGFDDLKFDEHGWLCNIELLNQEVINFTVKKFNQSNKVMVAKNKNNQWTYGWNTSTNTSGSYSSPSIWGAFFKNKEDALNEAIKKFIDFHKKSKEKISDQFIKLAMDKINVEQGQLSLF